MMTYGHVPCRTLLRTSAAVALSAAIVLLCAAPARAAEVSPGDKSEVLAFDDFEDVLSLEWEILHPDPSHYSLAAKRGGLVVTTQNGSFSWSHQNDYENLFLIDCPEAPGKAVQVTVHVSSFIPEAHWNQAGLIFWNDEDNYVKCCRQTWYGRPIVAVVQESGGSLVNTVHHPLDAVIDEIWLRLTKQGDVFELSTSLDGTSYVTHGSTRWGDGTAKKVGLTAVNGTNTGAPELDAAFESFEVAAVSAKPADQIAPPGGELPRVQWTGPGRPAGLLAVPPAAVPQRELPAPRAAVFAETKGARKVFQAEYLHRSRGFDYLRARMEKFVGDDGTHYLTLNMSDNDYLLVTDDQGRPRVYRSGPSEFRFSKGKAARVFGGKEYDQPVGNDTLPDFNSRPDPYLIQYVLLRAYDYEKGGNQRFKVYDVDAKGDALSIYEIALEDKGKETIIVPAGKFTARHLVQTQLTPSNTWFKKRPGHVTDYWVGDDWTIYRIHRHREPYELLLIEIRR